MGKKTKGFRKTSRSDKRIQKLYDDAIREVKERNVKIDHDFSCDETEEEKGKDNSQDGKTRKRPEKILQETLKKQEESRKQRAALSVPVSRLVPFKMDEKGFLFPRDFRRQSASLSWIPLTENPESLFRQTTEYNARRSLCSELNGDCAEGDETSTNMEDSEESKSLSVTDILQVLPLRAGSEDNDRDSLPETSTKDAQLPPIYKQDLWRETMRHASVPSRSIPAKQDAWSIRDPTSLMVGKQELYRREKCKSTVSLAERRTRLRAASTSGFLP